MYLTIKETAEYLSLSEAYIEQLIREKKIPVIDDGQQYLINKEQFNSHLEQMEKYKELVEAILNEPIPEDPDVKDED
ncbi:excisionase family DNA-binding protein [Bacillus sonorensis]|uniref:excisionase family DNA-binding protein n=1 Tax=Bacillus sonorensis TaxID=119858 RepID=UPI00227F1E8B|nr:excisionase family DNA-binding protein [Bacillus sonorensis]MCY8088567.1 excisionase family DNA-binding protein [Bacillus sonorensis]